MWIVVSQKYGTNSIGLQRALGISYSTAWNILHKLRRAMVRPGREPLSGTVEVDEVYYDGLSEGSPGRSATDNKALVVLAVEIKGSAIGRVRLRRILSSFGDNRLGFIQENVQNGTTVINDG
jgi:hypothetical protein